ncbi:uncharacterized protein LOC110692224 [Chenopodium quinoa]|uniref:uncharacterized protein LOC110692224 n=1 Tax=Chenopodium quinoa TaxID=63459 RepID=UPI000B78CA3F|nr:uncharacterized protein LOC110692224 [Chenopodium quinoa]
MCYNVHGLSKEKHLGITLNEHGQPVGHHDDKTCNEFTSFSGTIARKPNILPLTVNNWPILRNKKKELWDYVLKHYIVALMKEVEKKHDKEVEAMQRNYEDKRQQDRRDMTNGLRSFFSQL